MELPEELLDGLKLFVSLTDKPFKVVMKRALLDATDPSKREHVSSLLVKCPEVAPDTLRRAHAALLAAVLEHARHSAGNGQAAEARLAAALQAAGWPADRQAALLSLTPQAVPGCRRLLAGLGHGPARLVDVRWREVTTVQSSLAGAAAAETLFEVTLVTLPPGGEPAEVTTTCSRHQLQEVVTELRRAGRTLQTLADGTAPLPPPPPPPPPPPDQAETD